jgi:hypothetical protein
VKHRRTTLNGLCHTAVKLCDLCGQSAIIRSFVIETAQGNEIQPPLSNYKSGALHIFSGLYTWHSFNA